MRILYGLINNNIDVTELCYNKLNYNNIISIPCGDNERASFFTDPIFGTKKKIFIKKDDNSDLLEFEDNLELKININTFKIETVKTVDINKKLLQIQKILKIKHGSFNEEVPEQKMVVRYLRGNEKVLEIGGNIGRNSLIIASILRNNNNNNFVCLESDPDISRKLCENRDINNFHFFVENSALSKRKLIQSGWSTIVSDVLLDGYKKINTITLEELHRKYNIYFDTLVLDCEGAFYYILMDMPEILDNINLIIMENDYNDISHKNYIDNILKENNFALDYVEKGGWGPCFNNFFEVWKK